MKGVNIAKAYEPQRFERDIYHSWEASGFFNPDNLKKSPSVKIKRRSFSIVMPPPNTTGRLHLGHASSIAYEDAMVRYKRLRGFRALYVPGTDHAAIATQNKVEKLVADRGETRFSLGRERFLEEVRAFVRQTQHEMKDQIRRCGASCDWSREAYTLDEVSSRVVTEVFIRMYNDGLIYRGNRIVNWCPRCASTLADDEVTYVEHKTPFYYLKYGPVTIATARPETKFLDKTIVVHPDDTRYRHLVGKEFEVPWIEGTVKARVIADPVINKDLGTGAMTLTPAHSFEDFELAKKHTLEIVQIIGQDGRMTEAAGSMQGMFASEARKKVVEVLKRKGLIDRIDTEYVHNLSVCYRCETPVEPLISKQWFIDVNKRIGSRHKSLKELAIGLVRRKEVAIIPEHFRKVYFHWLDNLHDWCISRQIWWGHRIPVWYCYPCHDDPKKYAAGQYWMVSETKPPVCTRCGADKMHQDHDTLDTWFSSATWSFSTLLDREYKKYKNFDDWLKRSPDIKRFHPTTVLETGYDILFFWVARMILVTAYVMHERPFETVYLHGLVRDKQGRKMTKSLGNGIDPIEVIDKYGADALRLSLVIGSGPGQDVRMYDEKIAGFRNFVNKLWNVSRFILATVEDVRRTVKKPKPATLAQRWILGRLDEVIRRVTRHLENWQFSLAGELLYDFTWHDLADWYLEIAKIESTQLPAAKKQTDALLLHILERLLILWHPFAPFVTEVLWAKLGAGYPVMVARWPKPRAGTITSAKRIVQQFQRLKDSITAIRTLRAENKIPAETILPVAISGWSEVMHHRAVIEKLARCSLGGPQVSGKEIRGTGFVITADVRVQMNDTKRDALNRYVTKLEAKLSNKDFVRRAPAEVIEQEKRKLKEAKEKLGTDDE